MDPYSSHLPILEAIYHLVPIDSVFEYGCGRFSTPFFASNSKAVVSVEMQDVAWYTTMSEELKSYPNLTLMESLGAWPALELYRALDRRWDLVFVDGHADSRWNCINLATLNCDIIVAHDTESPGYGWSHVLLPPNYVEIRFKEHHPWTSVWTCNKLLKSHFAKTAYLIEGAL